MNIIEVDFATPEYDDTVALRDKILRKPLNLEFSVEELAKEYTDIHLAAYDEAWILRGCLVLTPKPEKVMKMRQVAVDTAAQSTGIGRAIVEKCEVITRLKGYELMELSARQTAVPFYLKLAYHTEGAQFEEVGIAHFKMVKRL
jgi:predicted GNAT family N-acyltransferase